MIDKKITLHIGLHKTGTTYIQRIILPSFKTVSTIRSVNSHKDLFGADFSNEILISDESISGSPWKGTYLLDFLKNVEKIKILFGNPRIIFGIRRHDRFLLSIYKQYLHQKGTKNVDYLFNLNNTGIIKHDELFFEQRILTLKKHFSDVFVYSQESLRERPQQFIDSLIHFLSIDESVTVSQLSSLKENEGVKSLFQVRLLKKLNTLSWNLERISPWLSLYSRVLRKFKLTPRDFCQYYLKGINSNKFNINNELISHLLEYYKSDWENCQKHLEY